jgi:hypothetical protein
MRGLKAEDAISGTKIDASGRGREEHTFMHGISPWENRAGAALWHTSSVPIDACVSVVIISGKDGGTMMPVRTARRTMRAFHLMESTIGILKKAVNIKF